MDLSAIGFDSSSLFVSAAQQNQQMEQLANAALSQGMNLYQDGKYAEAADAFRRSVTLSPSSDYAQTSPITWPVPTSRSGGSTRRPTPTR